MSTSPPVTRAGREALSRFFLPEHGEVGRAGLPAENEETLREAEKRPAALVRRGWGLASVLGGSCCTALHPGRPAGHDLALSRPFLLQPVRLGSRSVSKKASTGTKGVTHLYHLQKCPCPTLCRHPVPITRAPAPGADTVQGRGEGVSRATSPQTLLQSSCLRFAGDLTRSPAAVLKKISLGGQKRGHFKRASRLSVGGPGFSKGSRRVLGVHWGPAPTLGCCGAPSSPSGHLPEQRARRSPTHTSAHQPPCCQPGKPGAGLRRPPTNPSPLLPHRGLTSPV